MICSKCKLEKTAEEIKPYMKWCRSCYNAYKRAWKKTPVGREATKRYRISPKAKATQKRYYSKWYGEHGRKRAADYVQKIGVWRKAHPEAVRTMNTVRIAVVNGTVVHPTVCSNCQEVKKVVAHHDDYAKPLEIRWLCYSCDKLEHSKRRLTTNL